MPKVLVPIKGIGKAFGRWIVVKDDTAEWLVKCECGATKRVRRDFLIRGLSKGCVSCSQKSHGMEGSSVYNVWAGMIQRCTNEKYRWYHRYGGRGIKVCEEWRDFSVFFAEMGDKPKGKTLDRIDNDGDYCKENCRWATVKQQIRNRTKTVFLEFRGERKSMGEWAEIMGVKRKILENRIRVGWSVEDALTKPNRKGKK